MRALWPRFPLLPAAAYWLWVPFWRWQGGLRWDHVAMAVAATCLAYASKGTKRLFIGMIPLSAVAFLYDGMRLFKNVGLTPSSVHVCDFRKVELRWFGVASGTSRVTLQDWFQVHHALPLDLFSAVPYGIFLYLVVGYAVFLMKRDFAAQQRFAWGFFLLNLAGFVTYHLYPVAPPWYFHKYGCSVDLSAPPDPGTSLARVDAWLGFPYFHRFYSRASDIFGAVPSLHVAYPLLMIIEGWRQHGAAGRLPLLLFYFSMCFAATYLDHHWVIDIIAGSTYACLVAWLMRRIIPRVLPVAARAKLPAEATE
jgi:hypothetical protein